ncbi:MAG: SH3 domain-containing protein [Chloroflexota bacterium]
MKRYSYFIGKSRRWWPVGLVVLIMMLVPAMMGITSSKILAQSGGTLTDGSSIAGNLTDQTRVILYNFSGEPGQLVNIQVIGTTPGMAPTISLLSPAQQQIANSNSDPFNTVGAAARLSFQLADSGTYSVLVGGTNGGYLLRFSLHPAGQSTALTLNTAVTAIFTTDAGPQTFNFSVNPGDSATLALISSNPDFVFSTQVYDGTGQLIAILSGPALKTQALVLCEATGTYQVVVGASNPAIQGNISITVSNAANGACVPAPANASPQVSSPGTNVGSAVPPANVCAATLKTNGVINLRRGPSVFHAIVGQFEPGTYMIVSGHSVDGKWYVSTDGTRQSWMQGSLVNLNGPCNNLQMVQAPPAPYTRTPLPTATPIIITATPVVITATPIILTAIPVSPTPAIVTAIAPSATP